MVPRRTLVGVFPRITSLSYTFQRRIAVKFTTNPFTLAAIVAGLLLAHVVACWSQTSDTNGTPVPRAIELKSHGGDYLRLLGGPPVSLAMRSGLVSLRPTKSVGKHNTDEYEEIILVVKGTGEMRITNGPTLKLRKDVLFYCPPHREHDMVNTGKGDLQYVYIVAKTQ